MSCSPRRSGFLVTVAPAEKWFCKTRSGPQHLRKDLTPASRRQDHTIWPSAAASFVCRAPFRSQVITPALRTACAQPTLPRPPHPAPNVRDDRDTPLMRERDGVGYRGDLGDAGRDLFLRGGLDDPNQVDLVQEIRFLAQRSSRPNQASAHDDPLPSRPSPPMRDRTSTANTHPPRRPAPTRSQRTSY
jgi:hypothetical protein